MPSFFGNKKRLLYLGGLVALLVIPVLKNVNRKAPDSASLNLPTLSNDEAIRYIQKASQNYFFHEYPQATENYRKAISIFETRKDFKSAANTYQSIGDVYKITHHYEDAEKEYLTSADVNSKIKNPSGQAEAYKKIGNMHMDLKRPNKAMEWYQKALGLVDNGPPNLTLAQTQETIGRYYWKSKMNEAAIKYISAARETFSAIGHQLGSEHMSHILDMINGKRNNLNPHAILSRRPENYQP